GSRGRPAEGAGTAAGLRTSLTEPLEAFESLELRLAVGADFPSIELGALLLVADDLVGGVDLGETVLRLRIGLVRVGMQLLGELAEGRLDFGLARLPLDAMDFVGIAHDSNTIRSAPAAECGRALFRYDRILNDSRG